MINIPFVPCEFTSNPGNQRANTVGIHLPLRAMLLFWLLAAPHSEDFKVSAFTTK